MQTLEGMKELWGAGQGPLTGNQPYNEESLGKIFKSRVKKHTNSSMQYFWASLTLQIIVYSMLTHVLVKYRSDIETAGLAIAGILLFLPFTVLLMKKFKSIAITTLTGGDSIQYSLYQYVLRHHDLLLSFYRFKKAYEFALIPLSSAIGVFLTFKLFVPGGAYEHPMGAGVCFGIALLSCALAIRGENKKSFEKPLLELERILAEFKE